MKYVDLDVIYKQSDIISLHCPLMKVVVVLVVVVVVVVVVDWTRAH